MWIFSDLRRQHKEIRSWLQLGGLRLILVPRGSWWTPWFVRVASGKGAATTTMVIRVSDNNSRFDVARADDGNAEADPYMGAR